MGVRVLELNEDALHLVDVLSARVLLACERAMEPFPVVLLGIVELPFLEQCSPGAKESLHECLMLADLGLEELVVVHILEVKEAGVSVVAGLEHSVGASRPTVGLAAGDAHLVEMAHLEDGFAVLPTEERVREAKRYLQLSGDLDASALA